MALYYFVLKGHWDSYPDTEGAEFENESAARKQACAVALELMRNRELDTRFWRIEIRDEYLEYCSEVLFSTIDPTIGHLRPDIRESIDHVVHERAQLADAILAVRDTIGEVRNTMAIAGRLLKP